MSNVVSGLIKLFFGTKSEKDRKLIQPYVDKIKAIYPSIGQLTNDELRARSLALKNSVAEYISGEEKQIEELKAQLEDLDTSLNDKESISRQIDNLTEEIDRNRIEDDQIGFFNIAFQEMGVQAGNLWAELATEALCSPGNWADGKPFYGSRKFGKATVNNSMGNLPLSIANYEAARARMMGFCGADGKSLRLVPDTILVGPELEGTARMIFEAELVNDGQNAAISNIHRGECKIMVNTGITGPYAKYWFLVNTSRGVKPITVQKRKQGPLVRWDREDSPCVMDHNVNRYGLHYRGAAVAAMPHLVIGSFPAAE